MAVTLQNYGLAFTFISTMMLLMITIEFMIWFDQTKVTSSTLGDVDISIHFDSSGKMIRLSKRAKLQEVLWEDTRSDNSDLYIRNQIEQFFRNMSNSSHTAHHELLRESTNGPLLSEKKHFFQFLINKNNCNLGKNQSPASIFVASAVQNMLNRFAIRRTWGEDARKKGIRVLFFMGKTMNSTLRNMIKNEDVKYKDLIQMNFLDTYRNLTLKTVGMVKWASDYCQNVKFVLKTDDDIFVNIDTLVDFAKSNVPANKIFGIITHKTTPIRNSNHKWYAPYHLYPFDYYPDYALGLGYVFPSSVAASLYTNSLGLQKFPFEDVFMTGFVAEKAGIKRQSDKRFMKTNTPTTPRICKLKIAICIHIPRNFPLMAVWKAARKFKGKCKYPKVKKPA